MVHRGNGYFDSARSAGSAGSGAASVLVSRCEVCARAGGQPPAGGLPMNAPVLTRVAPGAVDYPSSDGKPMAESDD